MNSEGANSLGEKLEGLLGGRRKYKKSRKSGKNARKSRKTRRNGAKKQYRRGGSDMVGSVITAGLNKKH